MTNFQLHVTSTFFIKYKEVLPRAHTLVMFCHLKGFALYYMNTGGNIKIFIRAPMSGLNNQFLLKYIILTLIIKILWPQMTSTEMYSNYNERKTYKVKYMRTSLIASRSRATP